MSNSNNDKKNGNNDISGEQDPSSGGAGSSMPLLERIKMTLASTAADRWEQAGEDLDSSRKYQKPQENWEQVYCTDTKSGVLVLRKTTPITSNFFGGGYVFSEASEPRYLVELRARGWAPKMIVDPSYRSAGVIDKNYQVLADGSVARQLYHEVHVSVRNHRESLRRDFNDLVQRLISNIHEQIKGTSAEDWKSAEGNEQGFTGYSGDVNGMLVTVWTVVRDRTAGFGMYFTKYGLRWDCKDSNLCKEMFNLVDESVKSASLEQLGKVLEDML
jgi:hypothetical protein